MPLGRDDYILGFAGDTAGLRKFLAELQQAPSAIESLAKRLGKLDLGGSTKLSEQQGRDLARAVIKGFDSQLRGNNFGGSVSRALGKIGLDPTQVQALKGQINEIRQIASAPLPQSALRTKGLQPFAQQLKSQGSGPIVFGPPPKVTATPQPTQPATKGTTPQERIKFGAPPKVEAAFEELAETTDDLTDAEKALLARYRLLNSKLTARLQGDGPADILREERGRRQSERARRISKPTGAEEAADAQKALDAIVRDLKSGSGRLAPRSVLPGVQATADVKSAQQRIKEQEAIDGTTLRLQEIAAARRREQAAISDEVRLARQNAAAAKADNLGRLQSARDQGGIIGGARAAAIDPSGASLTERLFRTGIGSAFFSLTAFPLYAALSGVQQAIAELAQGTLQYEQSLSSLSVALDQNKTGLRSFASDVAQISNSVGLSGAAGIELAGRSVGTFGLNAPGNGLTDAQRQDFIKDAVRISGQIGFQSGNQDVVGIGQNLAGTLRSFGLDNSEIEKLNDSISVLSKEFGFLPDEILSGTARIAAQARSAGFNASETAAIVASQATRTGASAETAAGALSQVFAQADNPALLARLRSVGVETQGTTLRDQLEELNGLLRSGRISDRTFNQVSSGFGRGPSSDAAKALVNDFQGIVDRAGRAESATGAGNANFAELFNNINGEVRKLIGNLRNIITEISQSGLLDVIGAFIIVLERLTGVLAEVLAVFNEIPPEIRRTGIALLEIALALRILNRLNVANTINGITDAFVRFKTRAKVEDLSNVLASPLPSRAAQAGGALAAGAASAVPQKVLIANAGVVAPKLPALAGLKSAALGTGAAALAAVGGPVGVAVIAAAVLGTGVFKALEANRTADRQLDEAESRGLNARTPEELRAAAAQFRAAAEEGRKTEGQFGGIRRTFTVLTGGGDTERDKAVFRAERSAAAAEILAAQADARKKSELQVDPFGGFSDTTAEVSASLEALDQSGFNASERMQKLIESMRALATQSEGTSAFVIQAGGNSKFASGFGSAFSKSFSAAVDEAIKGAEANPFQAAGNATKQKIEGALEGLSFADVQRQISDITLTELEKLGKGGSGQQPLTSEDSSRLVDSVTASINSSGVGEQIKKLPADVQKQIQEGFVSNVIDLLNENTRTGGGTLTTLQIENSLAGAIQGAAEQFTEINNTQGSIASNDAAASTLQAAIEEAKRQAATLDPATEEFRKAFKAINLAEVALDGYADAKRDAVLARSQALLDLEAVRAGGNNASAQRSAAVEKARQALDTAKANLNKGGNDTEVIQAQIALAQAEFQQRQGNLQAQAATAVSRIDPRNQRALAQAELAAARRNYEFALETGDAEAQARALTEVNQQINAVRQINLQTQAASRLASIPLGDAVLAARAALTNAQAEKNAALVGTAEYYNAIRSIAEARKGVTDALLARKNNELLLSIDLTDPVARADAELRAALRQRANATGTDDRQSAELAVRNAQNSKEQAAFQQRLSDAQTAKDLGRISSEAYLSYLTSESNRLKAIANRTRQQQDQLDQVEKLMKEGARAIEGAFNIGDVKLPTIYEVRRAIAAGSGGIGSIATFNQQAGLTSNVTNLTINGVAPQDIYDYIDAALAGL